MQINGIIAEFNPFHNGHKYIIDKMRSENSCVVAVMSGDFVQRGEPAAFSKYKRAEAALYCGADLVVELPSPWSASCAQNFAFGAMSLLKEIGAETVYFGAETPDMEKLAKIAEIDNNISLKMDANATYAAIRQEKIENLFGKDTAKVLEGANNNLAIEYIKAANNLNFSVSFLPVKRIGAPHDSAKSQSGICSAKLLRDNFENSENFKNYVPEKVYDIYSDVIKKENFIDNEKFSISVVSFLRRKSDFNNLPDVSEGLDNKLKKAIKTSGNYDELLRSIKTKRYTLARVRRLVLAAFLELDSNWFLKPVPYIKILAMSQNGEKLVKQISKTSLLPIIISNKPNKPLDISTDILFNKECIRTDIYASMLKNPENCGLDCTTGIIKMKE